MDRLIIPSHICKGVPVLTEWREIIEFTKEFVNEYWFENLNLRGQYKKTILDYIEQNYLQYHEMYKRIFISTADKIYWNQLAIEIKEYCEMNKVNYTNYFYHKELVEKKAEGKI